MAKGATWLLLFKACERSMGFISTIILARLLLPNDFGLVAMAMSLVAILELLSAFGFDMALIQNRNAERRHYDTAWSFNIIFGIVSTMALILLAAPAAIFYNEPRLDTVIYVLALYAFVQGFENIGVILFRKDLQFHKEFYFLLSKKLVSFIIVIPLAFLLHNYWALIIAMVTGRAASVGLSYLFHPYRPRFSLAARHELFHFSKWLLINNILNFLKIRSADFIIGRLSGARALGLYSVSQELGELPTSEMVMPINRAVYPGYAKLSDDIARFRDSFIGISGLIAIFVIPTGTGLAAIVYLLIPIFLGNKWLETIPLIQILAFYGIFTALQTNITYVFLAINKPRITTLLSTFYIIMLLPLLYYLSKHYGAIGAATAYLVTAITFLPASYITVSKYLEFSLLEVFKILWRPVASSGLMFWVIHKLSSQLILPDTILYQVLNLLIFVVLGACTYSLSIFALWMLFKKPGGAEREVLTQLSRRTSSVIGVIKKKL